MRARTVLLRRAWTALVATLLLSTLASAGGPLKVAGVTGFVPGTAGTPLAWRGGAILYYTDQGDLSAVLPQDAANAFVADAFSRWITIATAAVSATRGGALDENVSGANVIADPVTFATRLPADLLPAAAATKPVAIVYDADGAVIDVLLGAGAAGPELCSTNAVYGGPDHYTSEAYYDHALLVINGNCAQSSSDLPWLKYQLTRALGRVFGLGWTDVNDNVVTRVPTPQADDYLGYPVMAAQVPGCLSAGCIANPDQPRSDDRAALSRLYPVIFGDATKIATAANRARAYGVVSFATALGAPGQPMQGVNVVARWINPATGHPSRRYVVTCVSGYLFRGNTGNAVTGYLDFGGERFDRFGSTDAALEGFFDLGGLEFPDGTDTAQYRITAEPVNSLYSDSLAVGPYASGQVKPSGRAAELTVTVSRGANLERNLAMAGSAVARAEASSTFAAPRPLPTTGEWMASLSGYGNLDVYSFSARAGRSMSISVTAIDDAMQPTHDKAQPVIGVWSAAQLWGSPPQASSYFFNSSQPGVTRLDAQFLANTTFKLAVADYRGDGRPDFRYAAGVLYADTVSPDRASASADTALAIYGIGFRPGATVTIGGTLARVLAISRDAIYISASPQADGAQSIVVRDASGASSTMSGALTFGAAGDDQILLLPVPVPATPVGGESPTPVRVRVVRADGVTPVAGASVHFTASPAALLFSECEAPACTLTTDLEGQAAVHFSFTAAGAITLTAALANGAYVRTTVVGTQNALDIALSGQTTYMAQGASASWPLTARVLANGAAAAGRSVAYQITAGTATLSSATAVTNASGYAAIALNISNLAHEIDVQACVAPEKTVCRDYSVFALPASALELHVVSGAQQMVATGQNFAPVRLKVTDTTTHVNAVANAPVLLRVKVMRWRRPPVYLTGLPMPPTTEPIMLANRETLAYSDASGEVTLTPAPDVTFGAIMVDVVALTGDTGSANVQLTRLGGSIANNFTAPATRLPALRRSPDFLSRRPPSR
jgi:hypothetical protein